jgi:PadR family transcriptional regulator, regulatory protein PadR
MSLADNTQLIRGILEGCILSLFHAEVNYGYRVIERLREMAFTDLQESTVYPILARLEKRGSLKGIRRPSDLGPPRKYYQLTQAGRKELEVFRALWAQLKMDVDTIYKEATCKNCISDFQLPYS